jgi:hypothetical protein
MLLHHLNKGVVPQEFRVAKKKNIVVRDADYQLIAGNL